MLKITTQYVKNYLSVINVIKKLNIFTSFLVFESLINNLYQRFSPFYANGMV